MRIMNICMDREMWKKIILTKGLREVFFAADYCSYLETTLSVRMSVRRMYVFMPDMAIS